MPDVLIMLLHKIYCNKRKIFLFQYYNKCIILAYTLKKDCKKNSIYENLLPPLRVLDDKSEQDLINN